MKKSWIRIALAAACVAGLTACSGDFGNYFDADRYSELQGAMCPVEPAPGEEGDQFEAFTDNPFVKTAVEPVSTFSVDADGASYAVMRNYLTKGFEINRQSVRIEEFLNYFTFDYPEPTDGNAIAINAEAGPCPWNAAHRLLRLGIKGKSMAKGAMPQANFVFLVDVSGSMEGEDRLDLLKSGLTRLLTELNPDDRISLITYSGEVRKVLESTPVRQATKITKAIKGLKANGSTAGGKALEMAYHEALANYSPALNNRIIMGTDGDFNVGVTNTDSLVAMVERYARKGIYMTCLGFGMGNFNDAMMEHISNAGNGTFSYIDCENEMMKVFVHERERFLSVASDTKCQVTFDSTLVSAYRLIGYENRVMANEDFEDDTKDAGEIGAGQTITALYEIVPAAAFPHYDPSNRRVFATFDCRYKSSLGASSHPLKVDVAAEDMYEVDCWNNDISLKPASENLRFAAGVAAFGMILRQSPYKGEASYSMARQLVSDALSFDPHGYRAELLSLMEKAEAIKKEQ